MTFDGCSNLVMLDVANFNTSKATDMYSMFEKCSKVTMLDVSKFDTSSVTMMACMFCQCSSLTSLDVSHFNTSQVTSMSSEDIYLKKKGMFKLCTSLVSLDLSSFDCSQVTSNSGLLDGCTSLKTLTVGSKTRLADLVEHTANDEYNATWINISNPLGAQTSLIYIAQ